MIPRWRVPLFVAIGVGMAASTAMADFLVMQKTPVKHPTLGTSFCTGKKDQDYCGDQHMLTRCKAGIAVTRIFCPSGCSALLAGSAACNAPPPAGN